MTAMESQAQLMDSLLTLQDVTVRYAERTVLSLERLDIQAGEVLAVIGPNGAGKSTLLLVLAGLLKPGTGRLLYRGQPITPGTGLAYRRSTALVLQEPLLQDMSVFDNVAAGLRFRRLPKAEVAGRVERWLQKLGISHLRMQRSSKLSGGEAQRVSLARAFALQPEILLLDEPFSALDAPTRARLLQDLHNLLAETHITSIFITHDLDEALLVGDRVAVMLDGELRQVGKPQQVFTAPTDGEVAAFVGIETVLAGQVVSAEAGRVFIKANGLNLEAVGEANPGQPVLVCLRPEDITLWPAGELPATSARNRLAGRITRLTPRGPLVRVVIDCGLPIVALVTRASASEMDLQEGLSILATFKASAIHLIPR